VRRPALVVVPLDGRGACANLAVVTAEEQERGRRVLERRDVVSELAFAISELLEALDELHDEEDAA
jgi:hypothetical protein